MSQGRRKKPARLGRNAEGALPPPDFEGGRPGLVVAHHGVAVLVRFEDGNEEQIWLQPKQRAVVGDRVRPTLSQLRSPILPQLRLKQYKIVQQPFIKWNLICVKSG